jgi:hypothetical protein
LANGALAPNSRAARRAFRTPAETRINFTNLLGCKVNPDFPNLKSISERSTANGIAHKPGKKEFALFRLILGFLFISEPLPERLGMAESVKGKIG